MKSTVLFLAISFFSNILPAQTTTYHPFPDSNAIWNNHMLYYCWGGGFVDDYYSISLSGDTIIGTFSYHKLMIPFLMHVQDSCAVYNTGYRGAIRQDIVQKKVYIIPPGQNSEELLYDFNMQIGDTLQGFLNRNCHSIYAYVVTSIDSILIGNQYRKIWYLPGDTSHLVEMYIIEGIGSTEGLLDDPCTTVAVDGPEYKLTCFTQDSVILYSDSTFSNLFCDLITQVNKINTNHPIELFPNPFDKTLELSLPDRFSFPCYFKIFNSSGEIIYNQLLEKNAFRINTSYLPNGVYFYQLLHKNEITTGKIICIH